MNNTPKNKFALPIVLLILAIGFWLWSINYLNNSMANRRLQKQSAKTTTVPDNARLTDDKLDMEINAVMESNIDTEISNIDTEFK